MDHAEDSDEEFDPSNTFPPLPSHPHPHHPIKPNFTKHMSEYGTGRRRIEKIFKKYDHDHDNTMSVAEMHAALMSMGVKISAPDAQSLWDKFDADNNGKLEFEEFYKLFQEAFIMQELKRAAAEKRKNSNPEFSDDESDEEYGDQSPSGDGFSLTTMDDGSEIYGRSAFTSSLSVMSSLDDNSMAPSLMPSISSQQPTIDLSSQFASHFIDDATVNDYASQFGKHVFNDPYIETIAKDDSTAKIMSDKLVKAKLLKAAAYSTSTVYPSSITETEDWRNMAGIIKKRELMIAFETTNHLRSPQQINLIRSWLEQHWEMARLLGTRRVLALAKCVQYFEANKDNYIITEGERGYTFYIIIDGSVRIHVQKYGEVSRLSKGDFFGERALTSQKFECRQASVISDTNPCKLLVLHKSDYDTIIRRHHDNIKAESFKVLKNVPLFSHWSRSRLERVCSMLERKEFPAGKLIFRQGDLPDFIYFIVDGTIEIIKEITVSMKNRWPKPGGGSEEIVRKFVNKFKILDIGAGKYFGEIAIVNNTCRAATCKTTEPTILLALDKFEFLNLLSKGHAMQNIYSQTQGYPSDEDILHLFTALKVQKKQKEAIKKGGKQSLQRTKQSKTNADASLPANYDKRRNSIMISATAEDIKPENAHRRRKGKRGTIGAAAVGADEHIENEIKENKLREEQEEKEKKVAKRKSRVTSVNSGSSPGRVGMISATKDAMIAMNLNRELMDDIATSATSASTKKHSQVITLGKDGHLEVGKDRHIVKAHTKGQRGSVIAPATNSALEKHLESQKVHRRCSMILSKKKHKLRRQGEEAGSNKFGGEEVANAHHHEWGDKVIRPQELHEHWKKNVKLVEMTRSMDSSNVLSSGVGIRMRRRSSVLNDHKKEKRKKTLLAQAQAKTKARAKN